MLEVLLAFIAGILTISAPCVLLPLPIILGGSVGQQSKTRPFFITLGFTLTFAVLALSLNFLIQSVGLDPNILRNGAVVLLALFAVFLIWPTPFEKLTTHMSGLINKAGQTGQDASKGNLGGFVMGIILGVIWTPCAGPILGSILTLIAQESDIAKASLLLIAYSLGAGLPMLAIAYGGQALTTRIKSIARYSTRLQQIFGVIMLLLAVAIHFQYDTLLQQKIVDKFPIFQGNFESRILCKLPFYTAQGDECNQKDLKVDESTYKLQTTNYKLGSAPDFTGISGWLNSSPLTIGDLKGKVVLVDFWTYSCVNCVRTLPYLTKWHETYKNDGLIIIGVHTPEFAFEKDAKNVQKAIKQHGILYPIAQDNDYKTWGAYQNRYWPAKYLIDQSGQIVYTHFGEGDYLETENAIRKLLNLSPLAKEDLENSQINSIKTPEIYLGISRLDRFAQNPSTETQAYVIPNHLPINKFALEGLWRFENDKAILTEGSGKVKLNFQSKDVFMVAGQDKTITIKVSVDSLPAEFINISDKTLYQIFNSTENKNRVLEITVPESGFEIYSFTFG